MTSFQFQDPYDTILERLREQELNRTALVIQRFMKGHAIRCIQRHKRRKEEITEHVYSEFNLLFLSTPGLVVECFF